MANRIIRKKTEDEFGVITTSVDHIRRYLFQDDEKQFGEIKRFLESIGIRYSGNKGLDLTLKKMISGGLIGKHKTIENRYPTYHYKKKKTDRISSIASEFKGKVFRDIFSFPNIPPLEGESKEKHFVRTLIHFYGLYVLYTQIQSWKYTSKEKTHKENFANRSSWLRNVRPIPRESSLFEDGITDLADLLYSNNEKELRESVSSIYHNNKKWKKFLEIQQALVEMYPRDIKFFEKVLELAPTDAENRKKTFEKMTLHSNWKKSIVRKNRKNPLKKIKPNQCPVCYYDGTKKVTGGQMKGKIFAKGFVREYADDKGDHWHCPACSHWETRNEIKT